MRILRNYKELLKDNPLAPSLIMMPIIVEWHKKNERIAKLKAEITRLLKMAYYEDDEGKGYSYKDRCTQLEAALDIAMSENQRLTKIVEDYEEEKEAIRKAYQ